MFSFPLFPSLQLGALTLYWAEESLGALGEGKRRPALSGAEWVGLRCSQLAADGGASPRGGCSVSRTTQAVAGPEVCWAAHLVRMVNQMVQNTCKLIFDHQILKTFKHV